MSYVLELLDQGAIPQEWVKPFMIHGNRIYLLLDLWPFETRAPKIGAHGRSRAVMARALRFEAGRGYLLSLENYRTIQDGIKIRPFAFVPENKVTISFMAV